jgi:hypothetical protein
MHHQPSFVRIQEEGMFDNSLFSDMQIMLLVCISYCHKEHAHEAMPKLQKQSNRVDADWT